jgi:hypothetical protein
LIWVILSDSTSSQNEQYYFLLILSSSFRISRVSDSGSSLMRESMRALKSPVVKLKAFLSSFLLRLRAALF